MSVLYLASLIVMYIRIVDALAYSMWSMTSGLAYVLAILNALIVLQNIVNNMSWKESTVRDWSRVWGVWFGTDPVKCNQLLLESLRVDVTFEPYFKLVSLKCAKDSSLSTLSYWKMWYFCRACARKIAKYFIDLVKMTKKSGIITEELDWEYSLSEQLSVSHYYSNHSSSQG